MGNRVPIEQDRKRIVKTLIFFVPFRLYPTLIGSLFLHNFHSIENRICALKSYGFNS